MHKTDVQNIVREYSQSYWSRRDQRPNLCLDFALKLIWLPTHESGSESESIISKAGYEWDTGKRISRSPKALL